MEQEITEKLHALKEKSAKEQYEFIRACVERAKQESTFRYLVGTMVGDYVRNDNTLSKLVQRAPAEVRVEFQSIVQKARKERNRRAPKLATIESHWPGESHAPWVAGGAVNFLEGLCRFATRDEPLPLIKLCLNVLMLDQALKWRTASFSGYHPYHLTHNYQPTLTQLKQCPQPSLDLDRIQYLLEFELEGIAEDAEPPMALYIDRHGMLTRYAGEKGDGGYSNLLELARRSTASIAEEVKWESFAGQFICDPEFVEEQERLAREPKRPRLHSPADDDESSENPPPSPKPAEEDEDQDDQDQDQTPSHSPKPAEEDEDQDEQDQDHDSEPEQDQDDKPTDSQDGLDENRDMDDSNDTPSHPTKKPTDRAVDSSNGLASPGAQESSAIPNHTLQDFLTYDMSDEVDELVEELQQIKVAGKRRSVSGRAAAAKPKQPKRIELFTQTAGNGVWASVWTSEEHIFGRNEVGPDEADVWVYSPAAWKLITDSKSQPSKPVLVVDYTGKDADVASLQSELSKKFQHHPAKARLRTQTCKLNILPTKTVHPLAIPDGEADIRLDRLSTMAFHPRDKLQAARWDAEVFTVLEMGGFSKYAPAPDPCGPALDLLPLAAAWSRKWKTPYEFPTTDPPRTADFCRDTASCTLSMRAACPALQLNVTGGRWMRCVVGRQVYGLISNLTGEEQTQLSTNGLKWCPGPTRMKWVPLKAGYTLIVPAESLSAFAPLTLQDCFAEGGTFWPSKDLIPILHNLTFLAGHKPTKVVSAVPPELRVRLRGLELYVNYCMVSDRWRQLTRTHETLDEFQIDFEMSFQFLVDTLRCDCGQCSDSCPCLLKWGGCSPWCEGHQAVDDYRCVNLHPLGVKEVKDLWKAQDPHDDVAGIELMDDVEEAPGTPTSVATTTADIDEYQPEDMDQD